MRGQVVALHPLKDGVLEFFPTPGIAEIPWIMLMWGTIYAAGQVILGSLERGAIGFLVTGTSGWLTWQFLIKKADREDVLEGEEDAHAGALA